jgi:beta-exotoxin I transport system permease protein
MNWSLLKTTLYRSRFTLGLCLVLVIAFEWFFVHITGVIQARIGILGILGTLPKGLLKVIGAEDIDLASPLGMLSLGYIHPLPWLALLTWIVGRASDAIAGEIERGTMDLLLAQPVARIKVFITHALVICTGLLLIGAAMWLGTYLGLLTFVVPEQRPSPWPFWRAAVSIFWIGWCVAGYAFLFSSLDHSRWRAVAATVILTILQELCNVVGSFWAPAEWLRRLSISGNCQLQRFLFDTDLMVEQWTVLALAGLATHLAACWIFCHRDLPAAV